MQPVRVGINGFGRIGRLVLRILTAQPERFEVVGINDLGKPKDLANLFKFDSVQGNLRQTVVATDDSIVINGKSIKIFGKRDPRELPWGDLGADVVVESTGIFTARAKDGKAGYDSHLAAGAKRVVLSAPAKDTPDITVVMGVNDDKLTSDHRCVSNASCTTNCLAPMAKVLHETFGIESGFVTTVHAYTSDQVLADGLHSDPRRARAAALNIIPTSTGAAKAVGLVLPDLQGKMNAISLRVPVPAGSVTDLVATLKGDPSTSEINEAMRSAANGSLKGILDYTDAPIVSSDIVGNPHSCIFDASWTMKLQGRMVKVLGWYDNEFGYSSRTVDLIAKLAAL